MCIRDSSTYCHPGELPGNGGRMRTNQPGESLDLWRFEASRSRALGFGEDMHLLYDTPEGGLATRVPDAGRAGALRNLDTGSGLPAFMSDLGGGVSSPFLLRAPPGTLVATPLAGP